jgi:hypothetical protein
MGCSYPPVDRTRDGPRTNRQQTIVVCEAVIVACQPRWNNCVSPTGVVLLTVWVVPGTE